ncbi:hypothetical protein F5Y19DRAFT_431790 [Xylariaceae sp. FL1651]|nr:hypothetical protein F5Y19DRAFT_431790 [Xylariaceae sp. FL1651]
MTNLGLRITLPVKKRSGSDLRPGDSTEASLQCAICDDNGVPQKIGLNLLSQ